MINKKLTTVHQLFFATAIKTQDLNPLVKVTPSVHGVQSIFLLLLFFLVLQMIEANCHCLRQMLFINKKLYINLREKGYHNHETDLKYTFTLE